MSDVNKSLQEKISEYKNKIAELEEKITTGTDEDKKKYDFELADLKSKLGIAEQELKNTWDETKERILNSIPEETDQGSEEDMSS